MDTVDPSVSVRLERRTRLGSLMGALIGSSGGGGRRNSSNSHQHVVTEDSTCPVVYHSRHPRFHHPVTLAVPKSTQLKVDSRTSDHTYAYIESNQDRTIKLDNITGRHSLLPTNLPSSSRPIISPLYWSVSLSLSPAASPLIMEYSIPFSQPRSNRDETYTHTRTQVSIPHPSIQPGLRLTIDGAYRQKPFVYSY